MAKATLVTNFKDDILNSSMGNKRRYNLIQNSDGTVSLEDVSTYDQVGSEYGASQVNATNTAVNASADASKIIDSISTINATTASGYMAGALALKSVNSTLNQVVGVSANQVEVRNVASYGTSTQRMSMAGIAEPSTGNLYLKCVRYPANSTAVNDYLALSFDGTDFYVAGKKGGADTVTKKLGDNVNPSLIYSIGDMSNAALTYTYTATDATEYVLFVALNDIQTFSTTGTLLYAVNTSSWQESARSYGTTRIVKLSKGQTITAKARYTLEFVRLA